MHKLFVILAFLVICFTTHVAHADNGCDGIPNCELQPQTTIAFGDSETKGEAFYCTGDHPYFWGYNFAGDTERWEQGNDCFTTTENPFAESMPSKLDVTITNYCIKHEDYTISIACSPNSPPRFAPACNSSTPGAPIFENPGCPIQGTIANTCDSETTICIQTWTEQCSSPSIQYFCTEDIYLLDTTCTACSN